MHHKPYISTTIVLIVFTILVITVFQAFWLNKNYREQKSLFNTRTGFLFRETIFELQAAKLRMDTSIHFRMQARQSLIGMSNVLIDNRKDSRLDGEERGDRALFDGGRTPTPSLSVNGRYHVPGEDSVGGVFGFLAGMDSLSNRITLKEITDHYRIALAQKDIAVPFTIHMIPTDTARTSSHSFPGSPEDHIATIGFTKPVSYQLIFENNTWYLLKRIAQPILVSLLLLGITILSFVVLYKNQIQQQKLSRLKTDLINNITHELKTPISTVSIAIEALRKFDVLQDRLAAKEYLDISANEMQRLSLLVDKVLKLSLFESREVRLNKESFNIAELAKDILSSMKLQFECQRANVTQQSIGSNFIITADKLHITSMLYNLLDNALKYSVSNPKIRIRLADHKEYVELQIADNGIGIAKEYESKIFEKLFRIPNGNHHNIKGYGLGLSYVSYIIQRHSGSIALKSQPGNGSTFTIKLPRMPVEESFGDENRQVQTG